MLNKNVYSTMDESACVDLYARRSAQRGNKMNFKRAAKIFLIMNMMLILAGCGKEEAEIVTKELVETSQNTEAVNDNTPILDQYYLNDRLMIEMLINDDIIIEETDSGIMLSGESEQAMLAITISPGIQNLGAAGEISRAMVSTNFSEATVGELTDTYLFGARAKNSRFEAYTEEGVRIVGLSSGAIINQSYYNMIVLFEETAPAIEMATISTIFPTINVLQPTIVDQESKNAVYKSVYQESVSSNKVKTSPKSSRKSVSEWNELPYSYYSWWGDEGDYSSLPSWYFEPDWDYYSYYDNYWDWGWDADDDWWFYDTYSDYYDYDYYIGQDDYWEDYEYNWGTAGLGFEEADYYDSWSDPGDYGYDDYDSWSDPGDGYDEWSDPGDYGYDDYDSWSDPGDGYDEWSDPGDYGYDDYGYDEW